MKKLIIIRHGTYDYDGNLDEHGKEQMKVMAAMLAQHINGDRALMLHSTKARAVQSAEALNTQLKLEKEAHATLVSGGDWLDEKAALDFVRKHKDRADVLILVTHMEYGERLPSYFGTQELGLQGGGTERFRYQKRSGLGYRLPGQEYDASLSHHLTSTPHERRKDSKLLSKCGVFSCIFTRAIFQNFPFPPFHRNKKSF